MNDYVTRLLALVGDRDPLAVLEATPSRLEDLFWQLGEKGLDRSYGEGKWTARQIFVHLADAEIAYAFRLRQVLSQEDHRVQTFDERRWMELHRGFDAPLALELFRALRLWNLRLLGSLEAEQWARTAVHPERGAESLELMVKLLAGHDGNHIQQLEQIARG
ncbi:MAG: DinB family protein [Thermoanaerobaculaceae bacterium]|nr:DinB family protein [Thermoanaerobaculaceae bacterium]